MFKWLFSMKLQTLLLLLILLLGARASPHELWHTCCMEMWKPLTKREKDTGAHTKVVHASNNSAQLWVGYLYTANMFELFILIHICIKMSQKDTLQDCPASTWNSCKTCMKVLVWVTMTGNQQVFTDIMSSMKCSLNAELKREKRFN